MTINAKSTRIRKRRQLLEQQPVQQQRPHDAYETGTTTTVYRVDWQAPERGAPLQYRASHPLQLAEYPTTTTSLSATTTTTTTQQQQQALTNDMISIEALQPPLHELSIEDLNIIPETIWSYTVSLGIGLLFWILYLLLPRGFRKQYCQANRKRYAKRTDQDMPPAGYWLPVNQAMSDIGDGSARSFPQQHQPPRPNVIRMQGNGLPGGPPPLLPSSSNLSSIDGSYTGTPYSPRMPVITTPLQQQRVQAQARINHPPSPEHPALKKIPPNRIIAETMGRLQGRGIRLVAHGVHCDPKRVWIKLDDETKSVTWQTEFPRRVPNQSGQVSIVLMRGSVHRIALTNVLYIDVGKKTNALQRLDETKVPDSTCFSLLTQNGSLDLQANSKLERDSLVSCFSMILDEVHANQDWRALYETSPDPSLANSSVGNGGTRPNSGGGGGQGMNGRTGGGGVSSNYPNPSDLLVEV